MPNAEQYGSPDFEGEPLHPIPLLPELAEFLQDKKYVCITETSDIGTVYIIKAPGVDIQSLRGSVPMLLRHELYSHPSAPVIRSVVTIYDKIHQPLAFETFVNIDDSQQRSDFAALSAQEELHFLFYDEALAHRLTKVVSHNNREMITQIVTEADRIFGDMPIEEYDFDQAKAAVIAATQL